MTRETVLAYWMVRCGSSFLPDGTNIRKLSHFELASSDCKTPWYFWAAEQHDQHILPWKYKNCAPVLPEVASINVSPGRIRPEASARVIMERAARSFTLPAGLLPPTQEMQPCAQKQTIGMYCKIPWTQHIVKTNSKATLICISIYNTFVINKLYNFLISYYSHGHLDMKLTRWAWCLECVVACPRQQVANCSFRGLDFWLFFFEKVERL